MHLFISRTRKVMYFVTGLQGSLERLTDSAYLLSIFAVLFSSMHNKAKWVVLRLLICTVLFCTADFSKQSISKVAAARFHQKAYFDKMHKALKQEYFLSRLSKASRIRRKSMIQASQWRFFGKWMNRRPKGIDEEDEVEYHLKQHQTLLQITLSPLASATSQHHAQRDGNLHIYQSDKKCIRDL